MILEICKHKKFLQDLKTLVLVLVVWHLCTCRVLLKPMIQWQLCYILIFSFFEEVVKGELVKSHDWYMPLSLVMIVKQ